MEHPTLNITFRDLTPFDSAVLAAIHADCFEKPWSEEAFFNLLTLPSTKGWVALYQDEPLGFILVNVFPPEAEILTFAVSLAFRRQSVGKKLMDHFIHTCSSSLKTVYLEVDSINQAALTFYQQYGFKKTGVRPLYYTHSSRPPTDAHLMQFDLF